MSTRSIPGTWGPWPPGKESPSPRRRLLPDGGLSLENKMNLVSKINAKGNRDGLSSGLSITGALSFPSRLMLL